MQRVAAEPLLVGLDWGSCWTLSTPTTGGSSLTRLFSTGWWSGRRVDSYLLLRAGERRGAVPTGYYPSSALSVSDVRVGRVDLTFGRGTLLVPPAWFGLSTVA